MIPAILSCVFVIYLYYTLNTDSASADGPTAAARPTNEEFELLLARIESLQGRLSVLTDRMSQGKGQS